MPSPSYYLQFYLYQSPLTLFLSLLNFLICLFLLFSDQTSFYDVLSFLLYYMYLPPPFFIFLFLFLYLYQSILSKTITTKTTFF